MKKLLLSIGSISAVTIPVITVISCGGGSNTTDNGKSGLGITTDTSAQNNSAHMYPKMSESLYQKLYSYALDFYNEKGDEYFKSYQHDELHSNWNQNFIWQKYSNGGVWFKVTELYDYAHNKDAESIKAWNSSHGKDNALDPKQGINPETGKYWDEGTAVDTKTGQKVPYSQWSDSKMQNFPYL